MQWFQGKTSWLDRILPVSWQEHLSQKYAKEDVSIHWRPNFEQTMVNLCLAMAGGYLLLTFLFIEVGIFVLALLGMALVYYPQARYNRLWLEKRYKRSLLTTTTQELESQLPDNKWWLGKGFYWQASHSFKQQAIQQKYKVSQHPDYSYDKMGASWLHTLEFNEDNLYLDCEHTNGHMLLLGTTGAGKTRAFDLLIQQAILRQESVIIVDPKGDHSLRNKALATADKMNMASRFLAFSPAFAQQSVSLDLLSNYSKTSDLAQRIVALMPNSAVSAPFKAVSYQAVLTIIEALTLLQQKITLGKIYLNLTLGMKNLLQEVMLYACHTYNLPEMAEQLSQENIDTRTFKGILRTYVKVHHPQIKQQAILNLIELYNHDPAHLNKMIASLLPGLQVLASSPMNELISPELEACHDRVVFNLQSLTTNNYILYVGLDSLSDATLSGNIGSLLFADLAGLAGSIYNYQDLKRPINIFVDEAGEVVNDAFIQILNKGRGAGLRCFVACQTIADFNVRTGDQDKTRQMLGNFNNWLALRTTDYQTQKYLAESLRQTRVSVKQNSYLQHDAFTNNSYSEAVKHESTQLITPDILAELPNFEYIARVAGGQVIKGRLAVLQDQADA
ncbi:hypothetical protein CKF54_03970 [Psittacicella hinzii]|uniref:Uncharacterized protein n=1 Tax=Psittacicella hinzii TaxID=2028575 RepID=A0A3A1Y6L8_9GAMM|nr:conjugative transfer system coupling protein TraD [Psittacicella hinzii]RIY32858.1 hypothetical protein CKF54_03970 [Psittacicella hinzii]